MRAAALLLVATGCNQIFGLDEPSGGGGGGRVDAGPIAIDALDAAPCVGAGQDEDGDGVADVCDLCPYRSGDQGDSDGDGVGDDCDPSGAAKHRLVAYYPFTELTGRPGVELGFGADASGGSFGLAGGTLVQTSATSVATGPDYLAYLPSPGARRLRIATQFRVVQADPPTTTVRAVGLWLRAVRGTDASYPIGLVFELGSDGTRSYYRFGTSSVGVPEPTTRALGDASFAWKVGTTYRMEVDLDSEGATVGRLDDGQGAHSTTYSGAYPPGGIVGLRLRGLAAEFDYLAIIEEGSR